MMETRFPESKIPFGEQFLARDNKLRYLQPLRFKMIQFVWSELKAVHADIPVYMCMESAAAWRHIAGGPPASGSELVEIFSRRGRLPIIGQGAAAAQNVEAGSCTRPQLRRVHTTTYDAERRNHE